MVNKVPQITRRKIGSVVIIDLKGALVGPWALKIKENLAQLISGSEVSNFLINLKELDSIDSLGAKAILENVPETSSGKSGFMNGRIAVMEMIGRFSELDHLKVFMNEEELTHYFGEDFVKESPQSPFPEKRNAVRLKTAIPLEFYYLDTDGEKITFKAIVTDLSESGLFAEYLDVEPFSDFSKALNPREMKELHMKLKIPGEKHIFVNGIIMRKNETGEQLGIGVRFSDLSHSDCQKIKKFLNL